MVEQRTINKQIICSMFALSCMFLFSPAVHAQETSEGQGETRPLEVKRTDAVKQELQFYIRLLDSGNPYLDDWSRSNLIQLGSTAIPSLLEALENYKARKRFLICEILGEIKDPEAVPSLLNHLEDMESNPSVASAAARSLGKIGDRRAIDPLMKAAGSADRELVYNSVQALGNLRAEQAVDLLLEKVDSDRTTFYQMRIGNAAITALGKLRTRKPAVLRKFKSILTSDESKKEKATGLPVVYYVVRALEQIALDTKGPIMVSDSEEAETSRQDTIDNWIAWINDELGIEQDSSNQQEGEGEESKSDAADQDGE
jgi:hypothetical protein